MGITVTGVVDEPIAEVFAWHGRPGALTRLIPPWQPMRPLAEADSLADGRALLGLPLGLRWPARHDPDAFVPDHRFADERVRDGVRSLPPALAGPWRHEHVFTADGACGTRMTDTVRTAVPARALRATFRFRHRQVADDLAAHRTAREHGLGPSVIAVSGATGLVGTQLCAFLTGGGHRVIRLVRRAATGPGERTWDPAAPADGLLDGVDAVIHLAGAPIAGRFTARHRAAIRDSRVEPTRLLAQAAANATDGPAVFACASAVGVYGHDRPGELLGETASAGDDFLAGVVADWEEATEPAHRAGLRTATVRTGIVQSPLGGTLRLMRPLFTLGLGGRLGSGEQWLSWIDLDDLVDVYHRVLFDDSLSGPVNATAPTPVTADEYARTLGAVLRRPAVLPTPAFGPRLILGAQGARELALADQRAVPDALSARGHHFRRPTLRDCLAHQLGRS
ncbi:TIGR01777 family oxidoreductase [Gordonia shandongensis]|uniref:TIGR01777 family oxidoreductase n=1 Tax=Gordonia shandongensis TaxID=376351 RepID=UPI00042315FE|nr:TIGR01777 family oxidoreductase [Gordonia shandongensis]